MYSKSYQKLDPLFWGIELLLHQPSEKLQLAILEGWGPAGTWTRKELQKKKQSETSPACYILIKAKESNPWASGFQETVTRRKCPPQDSATTTTQEGQGGRYLAKLPLSSICSWERSQSASGIHPPSHTLPLTSPLPPPTPMNPKIPPYFLCLSCLQQSGSILHSVTVSFAGHEVFDEWFAHHLLVSLLTFLGNPKLLKLR